MIMTEYSPITLFVYNRPDHLIRTIEALQENDLADKSDLYIFSDAAKTEEDADSVNEVRKYIRKVEGFRTISIIERRANMGLSNSIITGVTEICNKHGRVIVLEDDLITSRYFLQYMNDGLRIYDGDKKVISIHGYIYPLNAKLPETYFLRGADCWGWATWKDRWIRFEPDGLKLLNGIIENNLVEKFNYGNSSDYTGMLKEQISGKKDSWAIRWHATAFIRNNFTLYPGESLVSNIGNDGSGTHSRKSMVYEQTLAMEPVVVNKIPVEENEVVVEHISTYFKKLKKPIYKSIIDKILGMDI